MASTLPTNIVAQTTGHPGLHNAVNAAVNEHDGRITSLEGRATALEGVATIVGAGRPDIPASMTTAVQAQVAAAPEGATFSSTDGASVGAWQWRKIRSGWIVTYGDTGWVDVTARLANGWTATSVKVKRTTTNCLLELTSPVGTAATASELLSVSLNGFGVDCSATGYQTIGLLVSNAAQTATVGLPFWSDGQITTIRISPSASVNVTSGIRLVSWASRASWPTTLAI